jgi:hypothetical protein
VRYAKASPPTSDRPLAETANMISACRAAFNKAAPELAVDPGRHGLRRSFGADARYDLWLRRTLPLCLSARQRRLLTGGDRRLHRRPLSRPPSATGGIAKKSVTDKTVASRIEGAVGWIGRWPAGRDDAALGAVARAGDEKTARRKRLRVGSEKTNGDKERTDFACQISKPLPR